MAAVPACVAHVGAGQRLSERVRPHPHLGRYDEAPTGCVATSGINVAVEGAGHELQPAPRSGTLVVHHERTPATFPVGDVEQPLLRTRVDPLAQTHCGAPVVGVRQRVELLPLCAFENYGAVRVVTTRDLTGASPRDTSALLMLLRQHPAVVVEEPEHRAVLVNCGFQCPL